MTGKRRSTPSQSRSINVGEKKSSASTAQRSLVPFEYRGVYLMANVIALVTSSFVPSKIIISLANERPRIVTPVNSRLFMTQSVL